MADRLSARIELAVAALLLCQTAGNAAAQGLADPTRPPSFSAATEGDQAPAGRQLQSILVSNGRKVAVIDGTTVPLGGRVGEARVVKITETEVTLKTGEETEVLKLYPSIDKTPAAREARARSTGKATGPEGRGGAK